MYVYTYICRLNRIKHRNITRILTVSRVTDELRTNNKQAHDISKCIFQNTRTVLYTMCVAHCCFSNQRNEWRFLWITMSGCELSSLLEGSLKLRGALGNSNWFWDTWPRGLSTDEWLTPRNLMQYATFRLAWSERMSTLLSLSWDLKHH